MDINTSAPVIVRAEVEIDASLDRVWSVHLAIDQWPRWQTDIDSASSKGPPDVGTVFHWTTNGLEITSTIAEMQPPSRVVWSGPAQGITAVHVWTFTAHGDRVTVHTEESWEGEQVDDRPEELRTALRASLASWLKQLKAVAELPAG